jgi:hypothetical protein
MKFKYNCEYDDIINLPHHVSKKHPQMSLEARAAQFAPFAALTGYEDQVKETARLTNERKELAEGLKMILNEKILKSQNNLNNHPEVTITFFVPDLRKSGGKYVAVTGNVKKIDEFKHLIIFDNNKEIPIDEIIDISDIEDTL